jgi:hypothetical protein
MDMTALPDEDTQETMPAPAGMKECSYEMPALQLCQFRQHAAMQKMRFPVQTISPAAGAAGHSINYYGKAGQGREGRGEPCG